MVFGGADEAKSVYTLFLFLLVLLVDDNLFYKVGLDSVMACYGVMYFCSTTKR